MDVSLDSVIMHEAGHLLGVPHSTDATVSSIMHISYDPNSANNFLDSYERASVQHLYGMFLTKIK